MRPDEVGALVFDVFGTVVDWRSSVIEESAAFGARHGIDADWPAFADEWRNAGYTGGMKRVASGELPWIKVDELHRMKLDEMLSDLGATGVPEEDIHHLSYVWHRLRPWPDTPEGLDRLRTKYTVASLSNGNVSLLADMAKNGGFRWDCVLSAELAHAYKPHPKAYETAADLLSLPTERVMMVAAHKSDLEAARATGMRAALIRRPDEFGPENPAPDLTPDSPSGVPYDYVADGFLDLADQMGCD